MKAKIMLWVVLAGVSTAFGLAALSDNPKPVCTHDEARCIADGPSFDGDPIPLCIPKKPCAVQK